MDNKPKKKEISEIVTEAEMKDSLRRCLLLLKNATLLLRMPDGGNNIMVRFEALLRQATNLGMDALVSEYTTQRTTLNMPAGNTDEDNANEENVDNVSTQACASAPTHLAVGEENESSVTYTPEQVSTYGMSLILKNRNVRGDIYKELQKMYADNLSQREIQRLAETSSPNLLMSYDDTLEMERRFAEMERKAMLRRIRERLSAENYSGAGADDARTETTEQTDQQDDDDDEIGENDAI